MGRFRQSRVVSASPQPAGIGVGGSERREWRSPCWRLLRLAIVASLVAWWSCGEAGTRRGHTATVGDDPPGFARFHNESSASCRAHALGPSPSLEALADLGRPLPAYMIAAVNGDRRKALKRWVDTLRWRCDIGDEEVLRQPHPLLQRILPHYPHYLHLPDRAGRLTYWEHVGGINQTALEAENLSPDDIVEHYIWNTLFTWDVAARDDTQEVTIVVDMTGFGLTHLTPTLLSLFKRLARILRTHFPHREYGTFFINAPAWWAKCYRILAPLVSQSQREKIHVVHGVEASKKLLHKLIDPANLPPHYWGTGPPLGESPLEIHKRALALGEGRPLPG